ncbi:MAG: hypothetical protein GQ569_05130 [Methylococcaceae bacterium]|nr:hypothetical protein [Methylococcaceae bacterium]
MHSIEDFDLSTLPPEAQAELYDFYLFLKQRHESKAVDVEAKADKYDVALKGLMEMTEKQDNLINKDTDKS